MLSVWQFTYQNRYDDSSPALDLSTKEPLIYDGPPIAARHYLPMVDYQRAWAWCRAQMISTEDEAPITLIQIYLFR